MSETGERADAGATLLEMLVVVAIMALIAGMTFPNLGRAMDRMNLAQAGADLAANLRIARADAAQRGHAISFEIAEDGHGYGWDQSRVSLPPALKIEGGSDFFADGTSTGGSFKVVGRAGGLGVSVDPVNGVATGEVS
jgi:prepilin-type N-terminal cleavage/methylation domain-containing protein